MHQMTFAKEGGAPSGNTGSPGDGQTCAHVDCHTGSASSIDNIITTDVPASGYLAGETYKVTVTINSPGTVKFGFQASPQDLEGNLLGDMTITDASQTKFVGGGKYVTHTSTGSNGTDLKTWSFDWTSEDATGDVTFYVAINIANNDDEATGDDIFTSSVTVKEDSTNIPLAIHDMQIYADIVTPVSDELIIDVQSSSSDPLSYQLLDINGRTIDSKFNIPAAGLLRVDMQRFPPGMYFIRIMQNRAELVKQVLRV
jgi:hypothetical protein